MQQEASSHRRKVFSIALLPSTRGGDEAEDDRDAKERATCNGRPRVLGLALCVRPYQADTSASLLPSKTPAITHVCNLPSLRFFMLRCGFAGTRRARVVRVKAESKSLQAGLSPLPPCYCKSGPGPGTNQLKRTQTHVRHFFCAFSFAFTPCCVGKVNR